VAPRSRSQLTTLFWRVPGELAASRGVPSAYSGTQLRSAPRASRYSAARRWPPAQACQNAWDTSSAASGPLREDLLHSFDHPERRHVPKLLDLRAPGDQEPGDVPAAVADGVVERGADRSTWCLDVAAGVDECDRHL
jgi:hypothetical protein